MNAIVKHENGGKRSVTVDMAHRYGMEAGAFEATLRNTVVPKQTSREQFAAFLLVAKEYRLNPITKEIYAFPTKGGGIQPIVSVDGWANLINSHPQCNGFEFDDHLDEDGKLTAITCRMYRKDREHPTTATEYMDECRRDTDPWKKWPRRMLRHKALIQAARYAFGFAGIVDPDEYERFGVQNGNLRDVTPEPPTPPQPPAPPQPTHVPASKQGQRAAQAEPVEEAEVDPVDESYDDMVERLLQTIADAPDHQALEALWEEEVTPHLDDIFPPDRQKLNEQYEMVRQAFLES